MMIRQIVDHHCQNFACGMVIGICGGEYLGMLRIKKVVCQANLRGAAIRVSKGIFMGQPRLCVTRP